MTATDVTGFDAIFSAAFFATFSRLKGLVLLNYTENLGKKQKISGEPPVEMAPRNCRFLSLVVVERVLRKTHTGTLPKSGIPKPGIPKFW